MMTIYLSHTTSPSRRCDRSSSQLLCTMLVLHRERSQDPINAMSLTVRTGMYAVDGDQATSHLPAATTKSGCDVHIEGVSSSSSSSSRRREDSDVRRMAKFTVLILQTPDANDSCWRQFAVPCPMVSNRPCDCFLKPAQRTTVPPAVVSDIPAGNDVGAPQGLDTAVYV